MKAEPYGHINEIQDVQMIVYCWFVIDNGNGNSGYALMSSRAGRVLQPNEHLFPTISSAREALRVYAGKRPIIMPQQPDWVPVNWKIRNLNAAEINEIIK